MTPSFPEFNPLGFLLGGTLVSVVRHIPPAKKEFSIGVARFDVESSPRESHMRISPDT